MVVKSEKQKKSKVAKLVLSLLMLVCMLFSVTVQASAEVTTASEEVKAVSNSLMQVRMMYKNGDKKDFIQGGTGFLINSTTLLTCEHVITMDDEKEREMKAYYGNNYNSSNIFYEAVVSNDVTITITVKKKSEELDFAVLNLTEAIYNRNYAPIGDSNSAERTQGVYSFGFPRAILNSKSTYTADDVTITDGTISKIEYLGNTQYIQNGATLNEGNSGGPLVDENGYVIGVNKGYWRLTEKSDSFYYAVGINQIKAILSDLGIEYSSGSVVPTEPSTELATTEPATTVSETTAPVSTAEATTIPFDNPNGGLDTTKIIIIAAIAVLVIILVVVVIVILSSSKKKSAPVPTGRPSVPTPPQPPVRPNPSPYNVSQPRPNTPPYGGGSAPTTVSTEGAGETSVLNQGAGETTVLGYQSTGASLVRKSTGEKISINKPEFTIGKEKRRVDYCIDNNNSVSRTHAKIRTRAGKCYIADLGSTNCTYVNGTKLSPNQEIALSNGDKIKISDEEFEFIG